jgi:hypothetical protein
MIANGEEWRNLGRRGLSRSSGHPYQPQAEPAERRLSEMDDLPSHAVNGSEHG